MKKGTYILSFGNSPFNNTVSVCVHRDPGNYMITPTEESGLPIKPPCLYGME